MSGLAVLASSCSLFHKGIDTSKDISLKIATSPCFGTCAVYEMKVENGIASYYGVKYPKTEDTLQVVLSNNELDSIQYIFNSNLYWDLADSYDNQFVSDLPSVQINYREKDLKKSVLARADFPDNLTNILKYIERMRIRTFEELKR